MPIDSMLNPLDSTPGTLEGPEPSSGDGSASTSESEKDTTKLANELHTHLDKTISSTGLSNPKNGNNEHSRNLKRIFQCVKEENPQWFRKDAGRTKITPDLIQEIKSLNKNYVKSYLDVNRLK